MSALYESCAGCGAETPSERCFGCLHDFGCGLTAPSNANTSGLEVVAWLTTGGDVTRSEAYAKEQSVNDPDNYPSALVTAASAQARIDAAEARADRLAKALERIGKMSERPHEPGEPYQAARAALQQETQP